KIWRIKAASVSHQPWTIRRRPSTFTADIQYVNIEQLWVYANYKPPVFLDTPPVYSSYTTSLHASIHATVLISFCFYFRPPELQFRPTMLFVFISLGFPLCYYK